MNADEEKDIKRDHARCGIDPIPSHDLLYSLFLIQL